MQIQQIGNSGSYYKCFFMELEMVELPNTVEVNCISFRFFFLQIYKVFPVKGQDH